MRARVLPKWANVEPHNWRVKAASSWLKVSLGYLDDDFIAIGLVEMALIEHGVAGITWFRYGDIQVHAKGQLDAINTLHISPKLRDLKPNYITL